MFQGFTGNFEGGETGDFSNFFPNFHNFELNQ
jgi:hypothetical protein